MKKILLFRYKIHTKLQAIISKLFFSKKNLSYIAMFHDIVETNDQRRDMFDCLLSDFSNYLDFCLKKGFKFVSIDELVDNPSNLHGKIVLTFDDGFKSILNCVLPLLRERKIPFTVFVTASFVGSDGYLSEADIDLIVKEKICTIGMHANEHLMFRFVSDEELSKDFDNCFKKLSKYLAEKPIHYAFPYGTCYAVSRANVKTIKSKNVKTISLTNQCFLSKRNLKKPYSLPRINVPGYFNGTITEFNKIVEVKDND